MPGTTGYNDQALAKRPEAAKHRTGKKREGDTYSPAVHVAKSIPTPRKQNDIPIISTW